MAKLELAIALKLIQQNFNSGINKAKASLKSLQYQTLALAGALGAGGLSLTSLISRFRDITRETNRANIALKNVSKSTTDYVSNVNWLKETSSKYGVALNDMTISFAKFKASADSGGVAIKDQKNIFESVTRAITAFGLSGQDANLTFMAIQQMMSKGKISAEELRRQLGERIPVAMQAMANAAGVPISQLDKLLSGGKLMSKDVMPKFAEELNKLLPNVNTDNLETSITRLGNQLIKIVEDLDLVGKFKRLVDFVSKGLNFVHRNVASLMAGIVSAIVGSKILSYTGKIFAENEKNIKKLETAYTRSENAKLRASERVARLKQQIADNSFRSKVAREKAKADLVLATEREKRASQQVTENQSKLISARALTRSKVLFNSLKAGIRSVGVSLKGALISSGIGAIIALVGALCEKLWEWYNTQKKINNLAKDYEKGLKSLDYGATHTQLSVILEKLQDQNTSEKERLALIRTANREYGIQATNLKDVTAEINKQIKLIELQSQLKYAQEKIDEAVKLREEIAQDTWGKSYREVSPTIKKMPNNSKDEKRYKWKDSDYEDEDIRKLFKDTKFSFWGDKSSTMENSVNKIKQINAQIDKEKNDFVATSSEINSLTIEKENGDLKAEYQRRNKEIDDNANTKGYVYNNQQEVNDAKFQLNKEIYQRALKQGLENEDWVKELKAVLFKNISSSSASGGKKENVSPLEKAEKEYAESLKELENKKKAGVISEEELKKSLSDLSIETRDKIGGILGDKAKDNTTFKQALKNIAEETRADLKAIIGSREELKKLDSTLLAEGVSQKEANERRLNAVNEQIRKLASLDNKTEAVFQRIAELKEQRNALIELPTLEKRDTTFDYKKSKAQINEEELRLLNEYKRKLEEVLEKGIDCSSLLEEAKGKVNSLEGVIKINRIQEDIDNLNSKLLKTSKDGLKSIASSSRHILSAYKSIKSAFEDDDTSTFEKILNVFNAIVQGLEGVVSAVQTVKGAFATFEELTGAKESLGAIGETVKSVGSVMETTTAVTDGLGVATTALGTAEAGVGTGKSIANGTEIATTKALTSEYLKLASAKIFNAHAIIPFAGVGIASGYTAAMMGVVKSTQLLGFANGGKVGYGDLWGDRTVIRVNKGERILNTEQQEWLEGISSGLKQEKSVSSVAVSGQFRLKGSDLVAVVDNERRRRTR